MLAMLNLKYYFCTFKTLGGDSKTSWWNTPKKRYWVIYIQSFCLVFWIWTFNFHKKQELIFLHHFHHQELPLPLPIYSASTERILFGFVVFFQSEESDFDAKVALKKILMREGCRCNCKEMNEWRMRRKIIEEYFYTIYLIEVVLQTSDFRQLTAIGIKWNFGFEL